MSECYSAVNTLSMPTTQKPVDGDLEAGRPLIQKGGDAKEESTQSQRRYCGGKLSFWAFLSLSFAVLGLLLTIILTPIVVCVAIPNMIQHKFDDAVQHSLSVSSIDGSFESLHLSMNITKMSMFSGHAIVAPSTLQLRSNRAGPENVPFGTISLPELVMDINKESDLAMDANFTINSFVQMTKLVLVGQENLMTVNTNWDIKIWGIQFYKNLALHSQVDLNSDNGKMMVISMAKLVSNGINSKNSSSFLNHLVG